MAHFLYATKHAEKTYHPIPSALGGDDVLHLLHDHSTLASIFWPRPTTATGQAHAVSKVSQVAPNITEIRFGPASTSGPNASAAKGTARMTSYADTRELVVEEDMPLGLKMTLVYRLCGSPAESETSTGDNLVFPPSSGPYLEVERSVLGRRPPSFLVKVEERPILKTRNLLCVLEEMGHGKDLGAALEWLCVRDRELDAAEEGSEKNKADRSSYASIEDFTRLVPM